MKRKIVALTLFAAALAVGLTVLLRPVRCLSATCGSRLLFAWPIRVNESFSVTFTHSVNQSPITDIIEWTGSELVLRKSRFKAFGAGVPVPSDGIGTEMIRSGGTYELIGIDKRMGDFTIITQTVPNHTVTLGMREARLLELAGSGARVNVAVKAVPFYKILLS